MTISTLYELTTPAVNNNVTGWEAGLKFQPTVNGKITAIRYYRESSTGITGRIWNTSGTLLASVVFSGESPSGWQEQALPTPLIVSAGTTYVVSRNTIANLAGTNGVITSDTLNSNGHLKLLSNPGVFKAGGAGTYPNQTGGSGDYYFVSLRFDDAVPGVITPGTASLTNRTNTPSANITTTAPSGGAAPYTYQWQVSIDNSTFTNISGATTATYTYNPGVNGLYYLRCIYGDVGSGSATSNVLTVVLSTDQIFLGFIGDSITAGSLVTTPPVSIASNTVEFLYGYRMSTASNQGVSGSYTSQWVLGQTNYNNALNAFNIASNGINKKYALIMLGTNDCASGNGSLSKATYKANLLSLCNGLISNGYKVVLNYPIWTSEVSRSNALLLQYQQAINELVNGVTLLQGDIESYQYFLQNQAYVADGIHPNQVGSNNLADLWARGFWRAIYSTKPVVKQQIKL